MLKRAGFRTLDGGAMAVSRAAGSLALFPGVEPATGRMPTHLSRLAAEEEAGDARSRG
jgi:shikimate 5-dehydrogenase